MGSGMCGWFQAAAGAGVRRLVFLHCFQRQVREPHADKQRAAAAGGGQQGVGVRGLGRATQVGTAKCRGATGEWSGTSTAPLPGSGTTTTAEPQRSPQRGRRPLIHSLKGLPLQAHPGHELRPGGRRPSAVLTPLRFGALASASGAWGMGRAQSIWKGLLGTGHRRS